MDRRRVARVKVKALAPASPRNAGSGAAVAEDGPPKTAQEQR